MISETLQQRCLWTPVRTPSSGIQFWATRTVSTTSRRAKPCIWLLVLEDVTQDNVTFLRLFYYCCSNERAKHTLERKNGPCPGSKPDFKSIVLDNKLLKSVLFGQNALADTEIRLSTGADREHLLGDTTQVNSPCRRVIQYEAPHDSFPSSRKRTYPW